MFKKQLFVNNLFMQDSIKILGLSIQYYPILIKKNRSDDIGNFKGRDVTI